MAQGTEFTSWACLDPKLLLLHPGREHLARAQRVSAQTWRCGLGRTPPLPSSTRNWPLVLSTAGVISWLYLPGQSFVHSFHSSPTWFQSVSDPQQLLSGRCWALRPRGAGRPAVRAETRSRAASGEPRPRSCLGAGRGVALPGPRPGGLGGPPGARRTLAWCVHGEAGSLAIGCSLRRGITALHEESPNTILLHVFFHRLADGSSLLRTRAWPAFAGR